MSRLKVIISGGGTGGHIFPAIAIANAIKDFEKNAEILFVGAKGKMEMEKVPAAGYPIEGLWISGFQRKLTPKNLLFPLKLISSMIKSAKIINRFKPDVVVGTGGFASGAILKVAANKNIPTLIQEQNSYPGVTNRLLAKKANLICVAYEGMEQYFPKEKILLTGNPVRKSILDFEDKREEAIGFFNLDPFKKTLLVIGGSLGARTINESILKNLELLSINNIQLIWQTGNTFFPTAQEALKNEKYKNFSAYAFINRMDLAYAAADLIVSRAGAIAVSEICCTGRPVILVPSPNVAEDHQTKNAMALVRSNAALMVKDAEAGEKLGMAIISLMADRTLRGILSENIRKFAHYDAAEVIAEHVIKLAKK